MIAGNVVIFMQIFGTSRPRRRLDVSTMWHKAKKSARTGVVLLAAEALENTPTRKGRRGRYKGQYVLRFYMPGLDPERALREMAKIDADTALSQSSALTDKFQRAMATPGIAEVCLEPSFKQ